MVILFVGIFSENINQYIKMYGKECIWLSSDEADEPRVYYTERSKSEKNIVY